MGWRWGGWEGGLCWPSAAAGVLVPAALAAARHPPHTRTPLPTSSHGLPACLPASPAVPAVPRQARIAAVNTILTCLGMCALKIPGVGLLSTFVFICGFIPIAGVIISTVPIAFVALTEYGFTKVGPPGSTGWHWAGGCGLGPGCAGKRWVVSVFKRLGAAAYGSCGVADCRRHTTGRLPGPLHSPGPRPRSLPPPPACPILHPPGCSWRWCC